MVIAVTIVHVFVSLVLVLVILLQAGRGGGLSDMFGGAMTQNQKLFGTETNSFLTRTTSYCAIAFIITCITLGYLTTSRSRSLMEGRRFAPPASSAPAAPVTVPGVPSAPSSAKASPAAPVQAAAPTAPEKPSAPQNAPASVPDASSRKTTS